MGGYILSAILLMAVVAVGYLFYKEKNGKDELEKELATERGRANANEARRKEVEEEVRNKSNSREENVKVAIQGILNHDVGAVLVISETEEIIYYNNEFELLFPQVRTVKSIADQKSIKKLFHAEEYASEELSKIYEIRTEKLGDVAGFTGRFIWLVDITEHYKTNKKLQELKEMADEANRAKSRFLANMSHEIRTPINTVLGMDEIILKETTEMPTRGYAENIREAGTTLLSIVNDLLDFSKIECGKMEILPVEYEVASLLTEIINMIEIKAVNKQLEFIPVISEDIPYLLFGDEIRIKQIMSNLLTNAVKYTKEGSVVFKVSWKEAGDSSIDLIISVTDTGIGIKEEDQVHLFESFSRMDTRRNRSVEGTGLGLAICKRLVEAMHGTIKIQSEYNKGTTVVVDIPQRIEEAGPFLSLKNKEIKVVLYGDIPAMAYMLEMPFAISAWPDMDSYNYAVMEADLQRIMKEASAAFRAQPRV